jgi:hypothetical protein
VSNRTSCHLHCYRNMTDLSAEDRAETSATTDAATPGSRLVYAAPVHTLSLVIADLAWSRIQGAIKSVDLIVARRGDDSLAVENTASGLPDVPSEIWDVVKEHAEEDLYKAEEDSFFKWLHSEGPALDDSDSENEADGDNRARSISPHQTDAKDADPACGASWEGCLISSTAVMR